jgi:sulfate transport system ATP-binding protein
MIAGLEEASLGDIMIGEVRVNDVPPKDRDIAMVFQNYALYPHMNVYDNIAFGLRLRELKGFFWQLANASEAKRIKEDIDNRVKEAARMLDIEKYLTRRPKELSGGQRQRIALARALAVEPSVLLLDEPFGALDASVRKDLRQWLRNLHHELNVTSIFVTHDQEEAMEVASQVVVLNHGRIEQQGTPSQIYDHPANAFVSRFIGQTNVFDLDEHDADWLQTAGLLTPKQGEKIAHVRPHDIIIEKSIDNATPLATLKDWQHLGALIRIELVKNNLNGLSDASVFAELPNDKFKELDLARGDKVNLKIRQAHWFH